MHTQNETHGLAIANRLGGVCGSNPHSLDRAVSAPTVNDHTQAAAEAWWHYGRRTHAYEHVIVAPTGSCVAA